MTPTGVGKEGVMFCSVRRYRIGAGTIEDLAKRVEDEFVPIVSEIDGFKAYHVVDGGDGWLATVNFFDDRSGAEESDRRAADWVADRLAEFELSDVEITEGEVLVHKW